MTDKDKRWVRVWRSWRGGRNTDTYIPIEYIGDDSEKSLRYAAEEWAEDQAPNTDYSYGFEVVDRPTEEWIRKEIETSRRITNDHRRRVNKLQKILRGGDS